MIVTDFIANAGKVGDTTCASTIPEIRTVDSFPMPLDRRDRGDRGSR